MPRRRLLLVLLLVASWLAGAAPAVAAPGAAAELLDCRSGVAAGARSARFGGTMLRGPLAARMQMRFDLLLRREGGGFAPLAAEGVGIWRESAAGIQRYRRRTLVQRLVVPASYRARVSFRWLDADGQVIDLAVRDSPICRQPDLRPNLVVLEVVPGDALADGRRGYAVTVRNTGRSRARNVPVAIVGGTAAVIKNLKPGATRTVALIGPACSSGRATVGAVDAEDRVPESSSADNVASVLVPCLGA